MAGRARIDDPVGIRASTIISECILPLLADRSIAEHRRDEAANRLPPIVVANADHCIAHRWLSYRAGLIIQAAYGLAEPGSDICLRRDGGRGVAQRLGLLLQSNHIAATNDAYESIGKNSSNLCRGNVPEFDEILRWGSAASQDEIEDLLGYVCASLALLARPVRPMPALDVPSLTFQRVAVFLDTLLSLPSGGAHEQFAVCAFLAAVVEEFGIGGHAGLRVETKSLNASDASSKTAGDVEILFGGRLIEALEVSANDWRAKLDQARRSIRSADLSRLHVVAAVNERMAKDMAELRDIDADVSVLDVRHLLRALLAILQKTGRRSALERLYELLDRKQPNVNLTNGYVDLLKQHALVAQ